MADIDKATQPPARDPECSPSRAPDSAAFAHDPIERAFVDDGILALEEQRQRLVETMGVPAHLLKPRTRDPAEVVDIATARARVLPTPHVDEGEPTFLGDFRGQVPQGRPPHLGRVVLIGFALLVGLVLWALLPGGGS